MNHGVCRSLILAVIVCLSTVSFGASVEEIHTALRDPAPHPRLLLSNAELAELKARAGDDEALQRIASQIISEADETLNAPPLKHILKGPRLLTVSRNCLRRVYTLALAWRWTGNDAYANAAIANLQTVCAFPDWNPSHFLDTAEMSHAVAIGYDWLYDYMDEGTRNTIREGLIRHGMEPGLAAYANEKTWWVKSEFNWNQVCNSGLLIGALALVESDPTYANTILPAAVASLPKSLASYNPDGVWSEGPAYWSYATRYTAYGLAAMESALGTSFGLSDMPGLAKTAYFPMLTTGPTGLYLNFADSKQNSTRKPLPTLFWLARTYNLPGVAYGEHQLLKEQPASPHHLIWYVPAPVGGAEALPLDRYLESTVPVSVSRSAWNDENALFLGIKGGYNQVNHGHLDLGNFELDALGNRWARDLGSDDYNLPGYWDRKKGGKRWNYFRLNSLSHNVPLIDGNGQDPNGKATILRTGSDDDGAFTIVDLSKAYEGAKQVIRGAGLIGGRRAALIQDEFELEEGAALSWAMTTDAEITIESPHHAILSQNGKTLHVDIVSPATAQWAVASAEQQEPEHGNQGVKRLLAQVPAGATKVTVSICLRPEWPDGGAIPLPEVAPLASW